MFSDKADNILNILDSISINEIDNKIANIFISNRIDDIAHNIPGWGVLNREIVSFRSCVRTRGLVA